MASHSTPLDLLFYWSCGRPIGRIHLSTVEDRRRCRSLRAAWTVKQMGQMRTNLDVDCRGCGEYPVKTTCDACARGWCPLCWSWSKLCWKCYRSHLTITDHGGFVEGDADIYDGGPGGDGRFSTPCE
jgi:hypothetical protein